MFFDTMTRWLEAIGSQTNQWNLRKLLEPLFDGESTAPLSSAGLVIHGSASTKAKTGTSDFYAIVNGSLVKIAASTDMPALVGTVVNATFNVFCFFIDQGGVVTVAMGTAGSTLAKVQFPQKPKQKAQVGFILINPTGTGNFVGGTTALDDATVVPTAVYVSNTGEFDPWALIGV